jgi:WD40 repeat protein
MAQSSLLFVSSFLRRYGLALVLMAGMLGGRAAGAAPREQATRPEGVVACLGTPRFRALCDSIHFSADGKTLIGVDGGCQVRIWDAASGKLLRTRRLGDRPYCTWGERRSVHWADGKTLLIAEGASLQMWDLRSGKRLDVRLPTGFKCIDCLALSSDRRFLLLGDTVKERFDQAPSIRSSIHFEIEQDLLLWDTTTGQQRRLAADEGSLVTLAISPDGKRLASSSGGKGTCVYETATGKLLWREPKFNAGMAAFTPDSQRLIAAPGGGQSGWHVWDAATGQPSKTISAPRLGQAWRFVLSPDGNKLLVPTDTGYVLWDLRAGRVLHRWPGAKQGGKIAFAPDGHSVVTADAILRRWDVDSGTSLYPDAAALGHVAPVRRVFFTPDGKRLVSVGEDDTIRLWDVAAAKLIHTINFGAWSRDGGTTNHNGWALTPDGATLIGVDKHWILHRWSLVDGRLLDKCELGTAEQFRQFRSRALQVRVTPDGKTVAVAAWPEIAEYRYKRYSFSFWDMETRRLRRWGADPGEGYRGDHPVLSPDGRFAVSKDRQLFDTTTGEERRIRPAGGDAEWIGGVVRFSPDSRLLAAIGEGGHVWEVASGQPLIDLPEAATYRNPSMPDSLLAAFTTDGRRLAFAAPRHLMVCDLQTSKVIVKRPVPEYLLRDVAWASGGVAFAPDGRTVATGCPDGNILLWDVSSPVKTRRLTEPETAALWEDLAQDAIRGYAAVWRFQQNTETAVPFLRKRLPPVPRPEADWPALIRQLDSNQFEQRETASLRLRALGRAAEDALRQALKDQPTLEQKRRIEALLAFLEKAPRPLSDLRTIRAVAVLEGINTPAARRVLAEWAKGMPGAPLTDEAAQAIVRLRPASPMRR